MKLSIIVACAGIVITIVMIARRFRATSSAAPEIIKMLCDFAERNGGLITQSEHLRNFAIGFSSSSLQVFFLKIVDGKRVFSHLNLREIERISLKRTMRRNNAGEEVTDTIYLSFSRADKSKQTINVELYSLDHDGFTYFNELELAEKWQKILSEQLQVLIPAPL